ncbi:MAG: phospholipid carrier-dependent glycosyltransferase [Candidatus Caenarcaniphilales bacterium]|nr:phospholipid carrier-dependent glycosyltransferase [Candidatus Caenarcaniphilales bacterium]
MFSNFLLKFSFSPLKALIASLGFVFISLILFSLSGFYFQDAKFVCDSANGVQTFKAKLPVNGANLCPRGELKFTAKIKDKLFPANKIKVFSNSCITQLRVNEISLIEQEVQQCETYATGYEFEKDYKSFYSGRNLEITLSELTEETVFYFSPLIKSASNFDFSFPGFFLFLALLGISLFIFFLCRLCGFSVLISLFVFGGFWLRVLYLSHTNFALREHDHGAHLGFIHYLLNNFALPGPHINAATIHPPLYYLVASLFYKLGTFFGFYEYSSLQFVSVLANVGFVIVSILIFQRLNLSANLKNLAALLIVFWPGLIIHSVIINNDCLVAFFYSLAFLFLLRWLQEDKGEDKFKYFIWACVFSCLTSLTKLIGIVILALIVVFALWKAFEIRNDKGKILEILSYFVVILLPLSVNVIFGNYYSSNAEQFHYLKNWQEMKHLRADNHPSNFLTFNIFDFMHCTYVNPVAEVCGGHNVWIFLWKTSLFGEYGFEDNLNEFIASFMSLFLVFILFFGIIGIFLTKQLELNKTFFLFLLNLLFFGLSIVVGRLNHPVHSIADFRYVIPILLSCVYFYVQAHQKVQKSNYYLLNIGFYLVLILFVLSSKVFVLLI